MLYVIVHKYIKINLVILSFFLTFVTSKRVKVLREYHYAICAGIMGNYMNKLLFHADESRKENEAQTMEQPQVAKEDNNFCTPTYPQEKFLIDPRSASSGIKRTPILVIDFNNNLNKSQMETLVLISKIIYPNFLYCPKPLYTILYVCWV